MASTAVRPKYAYFEGRIVPFEQATISVMNHTFNYGTGAFGGLRGYWNEDEQELFIFRPLDHFKRLLNSARLLTFELDYTPQQLTDILFELLRAEGWRENIYIRPVVYVKNEQIGVKLHDLEYDITMFSLPFGSYVPNEEGTSVTISSWRRVDDNVIPARGKIIGAYVNSALIKTDAQRAGFDEALVLNQDGHVSEGSAANFFMLRDEEVITPPVTDNILEGITRRTVIQLLRHEMGLEVIERPIDRTEVYLAEEAFFCGTGVQIAAITSVDHRPIGTGRIGPVVSKLRELYFDVVTGRVEKYRFWNAPVYAPVAMD
ncbi:MAG TPA: branched-chain amino acid transaminase [Aggregatilineales bacterium]|nr:branched-chain amino acid transaminase [Aggregatilineales bacterium]